MMSQYKKVAINFTEEEKEKRTLLFSALSRTRESERFSDF